MSMAPDIEAVAEQVFVALADPTRRSILAALATDGPSTRICFRMPRLRLSFRNRHRVDIQSKPRV